MGERIFRYLQTQKARRNAKTFKSLIKTPASGATVMPLGARVALVSASGSAAGVTACTCVGARTRVVKAPVLAANELFVVDFVEAGVMVTVPSPFNLFVDIGLGEFAKIVNGA